MNKFFALAIIIASSAACNVTAANVMGTITLKGEPPQEKNITPVKSDPLCGKLHSSVPKTTFYVVGPNSTLADVVVSIQGVSGKSTGASAPPVIMDQVACLYVPQILVLQTGQTLQVKNSDPLPHNVHSEPKARGNKKENKIQMAKGPDLKFTFDQPEEFVRFKCDIHPWMFAWVTIFDHPYYAITGQDGTFKIANLPPGKYKIKAIHRKAGEIVQEVEVKDGQDAKVDFVMDAK
jgi:plastocyanin